MKKYLFSALALTGMLFMNSCSDDLVPEPSTGDYVNATFTIGTTEGLGTRAVGDGLTVDKVACAVYDAAGKEITTLRAYEEVDGRTATYSVRLTKGQAYRVAFFAYNAEADAYNVDDLKNVTFKSNRLSNDERRDAFTGYVNVSAEESMNAIDKDVTLTRPFAQLNLGIDADEYEAAKNSDIVIAKSKITVTNVYNAFSAYDNAVANGATADEMTFDLNVVPGEPLKVTIDGAKKEYKYLALNYLLVGNADDEKSLTDVEFVWESENGKTNNPTTHFINVPVQRNYRTNIIGKLLTNPAEFDITIDKDFSGEKYDRPDVFYTTVSNETELQTAINNAKIDKQNVISFAQNISGNITIRQKVGVDLLLDGCNKQFDGTFYLEGGTQGNSPETLAFLNINFKHADASALDFIQEDDGQTVGKRYAHNVTVENCTFEGNDQENVVAMRYRQCFNMVVKNCTAKNMHSLMWATGTAGITLDNVKVEDSKNGVSFGTSTGLQVLNSDIHVAEYGIRADGENANLNITNTAIDAKQPIIVRKLVAGKTYNVALNGADLQTTELYHVVFTNGSDDAAYVDPEGAFTISGAEDYNVYPTNVGEVKVSTNAQLKKAVTNAKAGDKIYLLEGTYSGEIDLTGKNLLLEAIGEVKFNGLVWAQECDVTLKGLTLSNPDGVQHPNPTNSTFYTTINNQKPLVGAYNYAKIKFEECTFNLVGPTVYGFYGHSWNDPKFYNCTFNCNGIRPIANNGDSIVVDGCTFVDQYHYSVRIFEHSGYKQTVKFINNIITGNNTKGEFEGVNISKKATTATILADFTIKGNTSGLKYRHHKDVEMSDNCTYDTDIVNFKFEKEQ